MWCVADYSCHGGQIQCPTTSDCEWCHVLCAAQGACSHSNITAHQCDNVFINVKLPHTYINVIIDAGKGHKVVEVNVNL